MGILTNPNTVDTNRIVDLLKKHSRKIGVLSYVSGVVWLVFLANAQYNLGTYFSENALLPGLVVENFYEGGRIDYYLNELINLEKKSQDEGRIPPEKFQGLLQNMGLIEVDLQNFTIRDPISKSWDNPKTVIKGTNVFGIFRAKRGSGTESLIFNAPYFPKYSGNRKNLAGIATMLALAEYFKNQVYWAKDLVFLVGEGHFGSLAWVKGHQEIQDLNQNLAFSPVRSKAGNIQAAINLVLEGHQICSLETKFNGVNGQLPNLDLVNLINKFIVTSAEKRPDWKEDVWKLVRYIERQSTGRPSGSHGFFLKYGIESVTLFGGSGKKCRSQFSFTDLGRILEATFRSLNNLLERLHQSFFFYLKTTPNRFISIGLYFGPIALILFPILLRATTLWLTTEDGTGVNPSRALFSLMSIHSLAIFFRWLLSNHQKVAELLQFTSIGFTNETFLNVLLVMATLQLGFSRFLFAHRTEGDSTTSSIAHSLVCFALLELSTALYSLALFNPSLIIILGLPLSPLLFFMPIPKVTNTRRFTICTGLLVALLASIYTPMEWNASRYFQESEVYGSFVFDLCSVLLVPILLSFVSIL